MRCPVFVVVFLVAAGALAREPSKKFQGWYHGYFEQYAAADVPADASEHVLVIGKVNKPGVLEPREGLTVSKAIEECGGFQDFADHLHVGFWDNGEGRFIIVDAHAIERKERLDIPLHKGDMLIVTGRWMLGM
jgi:protein involved in polysaccharide export with SLBB domain